MGCQSENAKDPEVKIDAGFIPPKGMTFEDHMIRTIDQHIQAALNDENVATSEKEMKNEKGYQEWIGKANEHRAEIKRFVEGAREKME